jgi:hypothetical protein
MWNMNESVAKKSLSGNTLRRFGQNQPVRACTRESGFVNHIPLTFRIGLSLSVFMDRPCGGPSSSRSGEEGVWHARLAD